MKVVELSFSVRLGIVRVVLRLVESVADQLVVEVPSRELLAKYLTVDATKDLLFHCAQGDAGEAAYLVPDAFRLVAVATKLQVIGAAPQAAAKKGKKGAAAPAVKRTGTSPEELSALLQDVFCPAYSAVGEDRAKEVLARATVGVFCEGQQMVGVVELYRLSYLLSNWPSMVSLQAALVTAITDAVRATLSGVTAARTAKSRKGQTQKVHLPLREALALLAACDAPAFVSGDASLVSSWVWVPAVHFCWLVLSRLCSSSTQHLATTFELVRATIEAGMEAGASALSGGDLHKMMGCWAGWALRCDAERAVSSEENAVGNREETQSRMVALLQWAKQSLSSALGGEGTADLAESLLALVVAQASDLLYLDIASEEVLAALTDCLAAADQRALSPLADHSAMFAALKRLDTLALSAAQPSDADATSSATSALKAVVRRCLKTDESTVGELSTGFGKGTSLAEVAPMTGALEAQVWAEI